MPESERTQDQAMKKSEVSRGKERQGNEEHTSEDECWLSQGVDPLEDLGGAFDSMSLTSLCFNCSKSVCACNPATWEASLERYEDRYGHEDSDLFEPEVAAHRRWVWSLANKSYKLEEELGSSVLDTLTPYQDIRPRGATAPILDRERREMDWQDIVAVFEQDLSPFSAETEDGRKVQQSMIEASIGYWKALILSDSNEEVRSESPESTPSDALRVDDFKEV